MQKKTKTKIALLLLAVVCAATAMIAGCSIGGETLENYLKENGATDQCVTYYGNGGKFNGNATLSVYDIYYKPDSYIISTQQEKFKVERAFFTFDGWYYGKMDGDKPALDEDGNLVLDMSRRLGDKEKIGDGEHLYVGANWNANVAIDIYLVTDGFTVKSGDVKYKSGDLIKTSNFGSDANYGLTESQNAIEADEATFLCFYADEQCTKPIISVTRPEEATENVKVYAKYIQGDWTVVSSSKDVKNMFNRLSFGGNYYLFTPDGSDIEYTDSAIGLNQYEFNITLAGNGVTINNLKFSSTALSGTYSVFGQFVSGAKISDLTLNNVTVSATAKSASSLYLISHGISGADISGFKLENVSFDIIGERIDNMHNNSTENWMFGGYRTDDEYFEVSDGITVINASLKLNGETLAENISKSSK